MKKCGLGKIFVMEKLKKYKQKRNFKNTPEPSGKIEKTTGNSFCVQLHYARKDHFDFRLEHDGVLLSWAVPKGPSFDPKDKRLAVHVEDHPVEYADFEGVIPKGQYGGGSVMLWDKGTWQANCDVDEGLKKGSLKFSLFGERLKGKWALVKIEEDDWLLIKEKDEFANAFDISKFRTSVKTGRTMEEISAEEDLTKRENPFKKVEVQLASLVEKIPSGEDWVFELKYDGYRIVAFAQSGKAKLFSRNNTDFTSKFKQITKSIEEFSAGRAMVLDGEVVISDEQGRSDFQALQNFLKSSSDKKLAYMVFDLLALDGKDLRKRPLIERKAMLEDLLKTAPANLVFSEHVQGHGEKCFWVAESLGMEGIVGKRANSSYIGGRTEDWIKLKCFKRQEFVVCGYTLTDKKASGIKSLILGYFKDNKLKFAGKAGTGIGKIDTKNLFESFEKYACKSCPFESEPIKDEKIFWLKPKLVAEIQFAEWTNEGLLRQASFKGLREDKVPLEVEKEEATEIVESKSAFKLSNPDKIIFEDLGVTKKDVADFYAKVSERMLKIVKGRILSVVRCHDGVSGEKFFKKHPNTECDGVVVAPVTNSDGETSDYFYIESENGLLSEVQLGSLEFHIWGSTYENLEKPDLMVFDLDPDEAMDLEQVRQGVKDLKKVLDELGLKSFLKTSGGKGYHVVVPFKPSADWEKFHDFANNVAIIMETKWPEKYTSNIRKDSRKGRIFIDWVRNGRGATSVAPYSLRARPGAKVSMPILWTELESVAPNGVDMFEALKRLKKKDPWQNIFKTDQQLR